MFGLINAGKSTISPPRQQTLVTDQNRNPNALRESLLDNAHIVSNPIQPPVTTITPMTPRELQCEQIISRLSSDLQKLSISRDNVKAALNEYLTGNTISDNPQISIETSAFQTTKLKIKVDGFRYKIKKEIFSKKEGLFINNSLVFGKIKLDSGYREEGKFEYNPKFKDIRLVDGTKTYPSQTQTGKREYIPELKDIRLVDGTTTFLSGQTRTGKHEYIPELKNMGLVDGKVTFPYGTTEIGKREYNRELNSMILVNGTQTDTDGTVETFINGEMVGGIDF